MKDGEDIQADLQQREEINTSKASPHRHKVYFYTLEHKKKILHEAFSQPHMVNPTAHKWCVQPIQIQSRESRCNKMMHYRHINTLTQLKGEQL
jgi:hypothetical protein